MELRERLSSLRAVIFPTLLFLIVLTPIIVLTVEHYGQLNILKEQTERFSFVEFSQIVNAYTTIILSFVLVLLYWRQSKIQEEQVEIQELQKDIMDKQIGLALAEYGPHLTDIHFISEDNNEFKYYMENDGGGAALNICLEIEIRVTGSYFLDKVIASGQCPADKVNQAESTSPGVIMPGESRRLLFYGDIPAVDGDTERTVNEWREIARMRGTVHIDKRIYYEDAGGTGNYATAP